MIEEQPRESRIPKGKSVAEQLESLNVEVRRKGPDMTRKLMEAEIGEKAKQRQKDEKPLPVRLKKG